MSHNPQTLLSRGRCVTITQHRRQVGSDLATFLDFFWREDQPWVVLQLPSGLRTAVPAAWTDLPGESFPRPAPTPEIHPPALSELARYCRGLRQRPRQAPSARELWYQLSMPERTLSRSKVGPNPVSHRINPHAGPYLRRPTTRPAGRAVYGGRPFAIAPCAGSNLRRSPALFRRRVVPGR